MKREILWNEIAMILFDIANPQRMNEFIAETRSTL